MPLALLPWRGGRVVACPGLTCGQSPSRLAVSQLQGEARMSIKVYYRENGPTDTGVVLTTRDQLVLVSWDSDNLMDWYERDQLVVTSMG